MEKTENRLETARAALVREQGRLREAEEAAGRLDVEVNETDPDDRAFASLLAKQNAARAKVAALAARVGRAENGVTEAQAAAEVAARATVAERLATLAGEIGAADDAITAEVVAFRERLVALAREQRARCAEADALGGPRPERSYWIRASPWNAFTVAGHHPTVHALSESERIGHF